MQAKDVMTTKVITVAPDAPARDIARLLLENNISALPVVDANGNPVGMVSEGDLTGRNVVKQIEKREWWLNLLAEGETMAPEFLSTIKTQSYKAREIMSSPVISISATTDVRDIANLLTEYHIKRVPVLEDGHIIGIVSRADLVRAITLQNDLSIGGQPQKKPNMGHLFEAVDKRLHTHLVHTPEKKPVQGKPEGKLSVQDFQGLMANFRYAAVMKEQEEHRHITELHKKQVTELINQHVGDGNWQSILHSAREAAEHGEKEYMMLRFPNDLCTDGGRAINVMETGWQNTLRGEAAEIYTRWEHELRPQGFHISARVLEYPGGFPGDIGLFLLWGHTV